MSAPLSDALEGAMAVAYNCGFKDGVKSVRPHVCTYQCADTDCEHVVGPALPSEPPAPEKCEIKGNHYCRVLNRILSGHHVGDDNSAPLSEPEPPPACALCGSVFVPHCCACGFDHGCPAPPLPPEPTPAPRRGAQCSVCDGPVKPTPPLPGPSEEPSDEQAVESLCIRRGIHMSHERAILRLLRRARSEATERAAGTGACSHCGCPCDLCAPCGYEPGDIRAGGGE